MILQKRRIKTDIGYVTEVLNEIMFLLLLYTIMGYSMHVQEGTVLHAIGEVNVGLIYTSLTINVAIIIYSTIVSIRLKLKLRK